MKDQLAIPSQLYQEVLEFCQETYPNQSRGIFASSLEPLKPVAFYPFCSNRERVTAKKQKLFSSFGPYYRDHKGFVSDPHEMIKLDSMLQEKQQKMVGLFHVHIDFPAAPSRLDIQTFTTTIPNPDDIWYAILSFLNPEAPEFRVFWIRDELVEEFRITQYNK